jgi:hypothetical protein
MIITGGGAIIPPSGPPALAAEPVPQPAVGADLVIEQKEFPACAFSLSRTIWKLSVIWFKG